MKMSFKLQQHFQIEIAESRKARKQKNFDQAWAHLERAHILGQCYLIPHLFVHFEMLSYRVCNRHRKVQ